MSKKRICSGRCKKFRVFKPTGKGRYESGQALCLTCDIWIDYNGGHLKDGSSATEDSIGWFCNCCNYRVRHHPRNKVYKEKMRAKINQDTELEITNISQDDSVHLFSEDSHTHQDSVEKDIDKINSLIFKAMFLLKYFKSMYLEDLKKILSISEKEIRLLSQRYGRGMVQLIPTSISNEDAESLVPRLSRIDGMTKKEIQHQGEILEILFEYSPPKETSQDKTIDHDVTHQVQDETKQEQDMSGIIWDRYTTSELSKSLCVKFMQQVMALDADMEKVMNKKYVALKNHGIIIVGIILQKSKIVLDFKLPISELDDTLKTLQDISQIGSWTSGKSRLHVYDEDMLQYGIKITKQCYNRLMGHINSSTVLEQKNSHDHTVSDARENIRMLTEKMINEQAVSKNMNKNLKIRLTTEFVESRSMRKIIENNPSLLKEEIKRYVRTSLRLPEALRMMENAGYLHPDPECSLQIALFAVNHYDWDGEKQDEDKVTELAQAVSKCVNSDPQLRDIFSKKTLFSKTCHQAGGKSTRDVSTAVAVWIATATLHQQYGIRHVFSNKDILSRVIKQELCKVANETIAMHISSHSVANNTAQLDTHRKLYRVSRGSYRLYRSGDYYNRQRVNGQEEPDIDELPDKYKDLIRWYHKEYCSLITKKENSLIEEEEQIRTDLDELKKQKKTFDSSAKKPASDTG